MVRGSYLLALAGKTNSIEIKIEGSNMGRTATAELTLKRNQVIFGSLAGFMVSGRFLDPETSPETSQGNSSDLRVSRFVLVS